MSDTSSPENNPDQQLHHVTPLRMRARHHTSPPSYAFHSLADHDSGHASTVSESSEVDSAVVVNARRGDTEMADVGGSRKDTEMSEVGLRKDTEMTDMGLRKDTEMAEVGLRRDTEMAEVGSRRIRSSSETGGG